MVEKFFEHSGVKPSAPSCASKLGVGTELPRDTLGNVADQNLYLFEELCNRRFVGAGRCRSGVLFPALKEIGQRFPKCLDLAAYGLLPRGGLGMTADKV